MCKCSRLKVKANLSNIPRRENHLVGCTTDKHPYQVSQDSKPLCSLPPRTSQSEVSADELTLLADTRHIVGSRSRPNGLLLVPSSSGKGKRRRPCLYTASSTCVLEVEMYL